MTQRWLGVGVLVAAFGVASAFSQTAGPSQPRLIPASIAGEDLYRFFCATCHGRDGKGRGPVAFALKVPPADLTLLTRRYGGTFPRQRVEDFVTNGGNSLAPAHGTSEMPVWGPIFLGLDKSDVLAGMRVVNVVEYVKSLQAK